MEIPSEEPSWIRGTGLGPSGIRVDWDQRLRALALGLIGVELLTWAGALVLFVRLVLASSGTSGHLRLLSNGTSVYIALIAVLVALLPDIVNGSVRPRDRSLRMVFVAGTAMGIGEAVIAVAAALSDFVNVTANFSATVNSLASVTFGLVVAALSFTGLSDTRFAPGLGGLAPARPRKDVPPPTPGPIS